MRGRTQAHSRLGLFYRRLFSHKETQSSSAITEEFHSFLWTETISAWFTDADLYRALDLGVKKKRILIQLLGFLFFLKMPWFTTSHDTSLQGQAQNIQTIWYQQFTECCKPVHYFGIYLSKFSRKLAQLVWHKLLPFKGRLHPYSVQSLQNWYGAWSVLVFVFLKGQHHK